jgi:hypothetical protein
MCCLPRGDSWIRTKFSQAGWAEVLREDFLLRCQLHRLFCFSGLVSSHASAAMPHLPVRVEVLTRSIALRP